MRPIDEIIIHCSATRPEWRAGSKTSAKVSEIRKWHKDRGWRDIGYHYLIDRDGTVATGRPVEQVGAHVKGHNTGTIGVCLIGGHGSSENDRFEDNYTTEQEDTLRGLLTDLGARYGIDKVTGHNQYAAKACPGFNVPRWLKRQKPRTSPTQSSTVQATVVQGASAVGGAVGALTSLDGNAQIVALVVCGVVGLLAMWILRERIRKWGQGDV